MRACLPHPCGRAIRNSAAHPTFAGVKNIRSVRPLCALLLLLALPACLSLESDAQKEEEAQKAVMTRHNAVMGQMDQLYTTRQELQRAALPDTAASGRQRRALLGAEAAMMDWMHQYRAPADSVPHDQKMRYFEQQQHKIDSVAVLTTTTLDSAHQLLQAAGRSSKPSVQ